MHQIWNIPVHEILAGRESHASGTETVKTLMWEKWKVWSKKKELQSITGQSLSVTCLYICTQNKVLSAGDSKNTKNETKDGNLPVVHWSKFIQNECGIGSANRSILPTARVVTYRRKKQHYQIRNTWKALKCTTGERLRRPVRMIIWKMKKCYEQTRKRISYKQ